MSLYDDIISNKETHTDSANDWSSKSTSIKLLQDHLQIKRTTQNLTKSNNNINNRKLLTSQPIKSIADYSIAPVGGNFNTSKDSSLLGGDWDVNDEYDPRWPNDYEKIIKDKNENKEKDLNIKSKRDNNFQITATRSLGLDYDDDEDEYDDEKTEEKAKSRANASIAPPPSLLENVEKKAPGSIGFEVSSVAAKIMAKMGYKEGQGLGKEEQGISKALQVEKTSKTHGKIIHENDYKKSESEPAITELMKNPSTVVLLRNMVGPGEVDDELEPETREECSKYGQVSSSAICELEDYDNEEEAVRIFIEFQRVESAIKALIDLNGRYFGGRIVRASFFEVDRYQKRDFKI